jgi:signal peptidase I
MPETTEQLFPDPNEGAVLPQQNHWTRPWSRTIFAGILSLVIPGTGHLFAYEAARGMWLALIFSLFRLGFLVAIRRYLFQGFVVLLCIGLLAQLLIAIDAIRRTWRAQDGLARRRLGVFAWVGWIGLFLLLTVASDPGWFLHRFPDLRGFRIPSDSMCPSVCLGERVMADMNGYSSKQAKRGDIVLLARPGQEAFYIKRIIGLPGDTVSQEGKQLLVNDQPASAPPETCGTPIHGKSAESEPEFTRQAVPPNEFFVIGDNLPNSFDSRISSFGPVTASEIRGKPLFLYWSPGKRRIGCAVR